MFKLHVYSQSGDLDQQIEIEGDAAIIGRSSDCHVVIDRKDISRRHARLLCGWVVDDLGSRNGTHVAGARIEEATLAPANSFEVGDPTGKNLVTIEVIAQDHPSPNRQPTDPALTTSGSGLYRAPGDKSTAPLPVDSEASGVAALRAQLAAEADLYRDKCTKLEDELRELRKQFATFQRGGPERDPLAEQRAENQRLQERIEKLERRTGPDS